MSNTTDFLHQFRTILLDKEQTMFTITGNTSYFYTILPNNVEFNPNLDYEIAMVRFESYNTYYNVTPINNQFSYTNPSGLVRTFAITPGGYQVEHLNTYIQAQMFANEDYTTTTNTSTGVSVTIY